MQHSIRYQIGAMHQRKRYHGCDQRFRNCQDRLEKRSEIASHASKRYVRPSDTYRSQSFDLHNVKSYLEVPSFSTAGIRVMILLRTTPLPSKQSHHPLIPHNNHPLPPHTPSNLSRSKADPRHGNLRMTQKLPKRILDAVLQHRLRIHRRIPPRIRRRNRNLTSSRRRRNTGFPMLWSRSRSPAPSFTLVALVFHALANLVGNGRLLVPFFERLEVPEVDFAFVVAYS